MRDVRGSVVITVVACAFGARAVWIVAQNARRTWHGRYHRRSVRLWRTGRCGLSRKMRDLRGTVVTPIVACALCARGGVDCRAECATYVARSLPPS
ncbi:hypothetical protein [Idiomarina fontislapidosi]|uniref:hypothetical protein n=1 Tax=Idiomarina fontislapidosi TaxID=263723 RepID=UPI000F899B19|nr:hypothetical protein [Idiomarina fontislapidosi]